MNERSERKEQRQAEALQVVGERWQQATGKADAAVTHATGGCRKGGAGNCGVATTAPERFADAAEPTYTLPARKSPWWRFS